VRRGAPGHLVNTNNRRRGWALEHQKTKGKLGVTKVRYIIQNGNVYKIFCIDYEWISQYTLQFPHSVFSVRGYQEKNTLSSAREIWREHFYSRMMSHIDCSWSKRKITISLVPNISVIQEKKWPEPWSMLLVMLHIQFYSISLCAYCQSYILRGAWDKNLRNLNF
jgi:hypothetical protein